MPDIKHFEAEDGLPLHNETELSVLAKSEVVAKLGESTVYLTKIYTKPINIASSTGENVKKYADAWEKVL